MLAVWGATCLEAGFGQLFVSLGLGFLTCDQELAEMSCSLLPSAHKCLDNEKTLLALKH